MTTNSLFFVVSAEARGHPEMQEYLTTMMPKASSFLYDGSQAVLDLSNFATAGHSILRDCSHPSSRQCLLVRRCPHLTHKDWSPARMVGMS